MKLEPYKIIAEIQAIPNEKGTGVEVKTLYVCDGFACEKCANNGCYLTEDVLHARKYQL